MDSYRMLLLFVTTSVSEVPMFFSFYVLNSL